MHIGGMSGMTGRPDPAMMQQKMMARFDTDGNGGLSQTEFSSMHETISARRPNSPFASGTAEELFNQIDTDTNAELSPSEMRAFRKSNLPSSDFPIHANMMSTLLQCQCVDEGNSVGEPRQNIISRFDADENGELNLEEFTSLREAVSARRPDAPIASGDVEELFNKIDADTSGELSSSELQAFRMANMPSEGRVGEPRYHMLSRFDADENGELNLEEFSSLREAISARRPDAPIVSGNVEELFELIDADENGELSMSELHAYRVANRPSVTA